jgi:hypothetical protein
VWHASGKGRTMSDSRRIALAGLRGVGDTSQPDRTEDLGTGIFHVQRLLTAAEREEFGIGEPRDIRGTSLEQEIVQRVLAEAPYLAGAFRSGR